MLVAVVGMKCTTILQDQKQQKNKVAMVGGIMFIISGQDSLSWGTNHYSQKLKMYQIIQVALFHIQMIRRNLNTDIINIMFPRSVCSSGYVLVWTQNS